MKNKLKRALKRELRSVHVSDGLRTRILMEAAGDRFQSRKGNSPVAWMAVAAAMILVIGLGTGLISLRKPQTDLRSLSQGDGGWVWVSETDMLYHGRKGCGGRNDMIRMELSDAKAAGRTACRDCIAVAATAAPGATEEPGRIDGIIAWPADEPDPGEASQEPPMLPEVEDKPIATTIPPTETPAAETDTLNDDGPMSASIGMDESEFMMSEAEDEAPNGIYDGQTDVQATVEPPVYTPVPELPEVENAGLTVYAAGGDGFYHVDDGCVDARLQGLLLEEAVALGLQNCPVCIGEGEVSLLRIEASGAENYLSVRASMETGVSWIDGAGSINWKDAAVKRVLSALSPVYMSEAQAEEFNSLLEAGEISGFRRTICCLSPEEKERFDSRSQFIECDDASCTTTLLLRGADGAKIDNAEISFSVMPTEYSFHEDGLTENNPGCSVEVVRTARHGGSWELMLLVNPGESLDPKTLTVDAFDAADLQVEEEEISGVSVSQIRLNGERYLLLDGDEFAVSRTDELAEMCEQGRAWIEERLSIDAGALTPGNMIVSASDAAGHLAYRLDGSAEAYAQSGQDVSNQSFYWATPNGVYYHSARNCSGMRNAMLITEDEFEAWGKEACPVCLDSRTVWIQTNGEYYHLTETCSGMESFYEISLNEAAKTGVNLCPICALLDEDWETQTDGGTVSVSAWADGGYLLLEAVLDTGIEWIYPRSGESGWSESKEVQENLAALSPYYMTQSEADVFRERLRTGEVIGFRTLQLQTLFVQSFGAADDGILSMSGFIDSDGRQRVSILAQYEGSAVPETAGMSVYCEAIAVLFQDGVCASANRSCRLMMEEDGRARIHWDRDAAADDSRIPSEISAAVQPCDLSVSIDSIGGMDVERIALADARFIRIHLNQIDSDLAGQLAEDLALIRDVAPLEPIAVDYDGETVTFRLPDNTELEPISLQFFNR